MNSTHTFLLGATCATSLIMALTQDAPDSRRDTLSADAREFLSHIRIDGGATADGNPSMRRALVSGLEVLIEHPITAPAPTDEATWTLRVDALGFVTPDPAPFDFGGVRLYPSSAAAQMFGEAYAARDMKRLSELELNFGAAATPTVAVNTGVQVRHIPAEGPIEVQVIHGRAVGRCGWIARERVKPFVFPK